MAERGRPRSFDRDEALARAMEVFWAKGYGNASVSDLTAAMGIGAPSLYAAFGSKDALFQEAVDHYGKVEGPEVWRPIDEAATAREAVEGYLMASAAAFSRLDKPRGCLVVLSALQEAEAGPAVCAAMRGHRADSISGLVARLKEAVKAGEVAADADLTAIATFYVTTQQGMSIQARDGASRQTLEAIAQAAMAAWEPLTRPMARRPA